MDGNIFKHREILQGLARQAMLDRGFLPDFSKDALAELETIQTSAQINVEPTRDLRGLLWSSIDNDDSLDLDQLTTAQVLGDNVKVLVAVVDVDSLVRKGSAINEHARHNTTSIYTAAMIFPMLPEKLSTDLTSLNFNEDRDSIVVDMTMHRSTTRQNSPITVLQPGWMEVDRFLKPWWQSMDSKRICDCRTRSPNE
jgi:exoribonuclease R